jgi:hypothetical protein
MRNGGLCIGAGRRYLQFNLGSGTRLAPDLKISSNEFGSFVHAAQAPMTGRVFLIQNTLVDTLSITLTASR